MVRAGKLVDGLKDEGIRWKEKIVELSKESKNLLANVIISSTVVSYFGPFTMEYRKEFLRDAKEYVIRAGVYYSTKEDDPEEEAKKKAEEEEAKKKAEEEEAKKKAEEEEKKKKEEEEAKKKAEEAEKKEGEEKDEETLKKEEEEKKKKEEEEAKKKEEEKKKKEEEEKKKKMEEEYKPLSEEEIEDRLRPENIPDFSLQEMLSDPLEIRDWNYAGLPADDLSIENAITSIEKKK